MSDKQSPEGIAEVVETHPECIVVLKRGEMQHLSPQQSQFPKMPIDLSDNGQFEVAWWQNKPREAWCSSASQRDCPDFRMTSLKKYLICPIQLLLESSCPEW